MIGPKAVFAALASAVAVLDAHPPLWAQLGPGGPLNFGSQTLTSFGLSTHDADWVVVRSPALSVIFSDPDSPRCTEYSNPGTDAAAAFAVHDPATTMTTSQTARNARDLKPNPQFNPVSPAPIPGARPRS